MDHALYSLIEPVVIFATLLDEMVERVDFTERMLTQQRNGQPKGLEGPG